MKPHKIERDIKTSGITGSQRMTIAEGSEHIVFAAISSTIYTDPIKAFWREYCTNAYDEHIRLDKTDVPFEITFPNSLSPVAKIRDFGRGLSEEQVFHFFGKLGASDKRNSDKMMGYYGFGCKVGHAYTDSFTVTSVLDKVKRIFNVFVGEDDFVYINKLGDDIDTDEPNGLEISMTVKPFDIQTFIDRGLEVIRYFPTRPTIKGLSYEPDLDIGEPVTSGKGWRYFAHEDNNAVCMMGVIAYDIDQNAMGHLSEWESELLDSDLHIDVSIGEVDITPSRENLRMTDRTKTVIKAKLKNIKEEMVKQTEKELADKTSLFEAKAYYWATIQNGSGFGRILKDSIQSFKWNGHDIKDSVIDLADKDGNSKHQIGTYTLHRNKKTISYLSESRLVCSPEIGKNIYYDDTDGKMVNYKRRAKTLFNEDSALKNVWLVKTTDVADFEKLTGLKVASLKSYNVIQPTFVSQATGGIGVDKAKRKKHQTKVFRFDPKELGEYYGVASDKWKIENIDLKTDKGLYLRIDRFQPTQSKMQNLRNLRETLNLLKDVGIVLDLPIYGIKSSVTDVGNLVHFDTWLKEKAENMPDLVENYALAQEWSGSSYVKINAPASKVKGKLKEFAELQERARQLHANGNMHQKRSLMSLVGISVEPSTKLTAMSKELLAEYPLLKYISSYSHSQPEVIEYLNSKEVPVQPTP